MQFATIEIKSVSLFRFRNIIVYFWLDYYATTNTRIEQIYLINN